MDTEDYEKQALDFLESTGSTLEIKFLRYGTMPCDEKTKRLIYQFTLKRGNRSYTSEFGESMATLETVLFGAPLPRFNKWGVLTVYEDNRRNAVREQIRNDGTYVPFSAFKEIGDSLYLPNQRARKPLPLPSAYSILAILTKYEPPATAKEFAAEFGMIDDPQRAVDVHKAVTDEYNALCTLYTEEEMQRLAEIN